MGKRTELDSAQMRAIQGAANRGTEWFIWRNPDGSIDAGEKPLVPIGATVIGNVRPKEPSHG